MKTECNESCCPVQQPHQQQQCQAQSACCSNPASCDCPVETAMSLWSGAFVTALQGAMADRLRSRIEAGWGKLLDTEADAVIEAKTACWQAKIAQMKAHLADEALKATMRDLWLSGDAKK